MTSLKIVCRNNPDCFAHQRAERPRAAEQPARGLCLPGRRSAGFWIRSSDCRSIHDGRRAGLRHGGRSAGRSRRADQAHLGQGTQRAAHSGRRAVGPKGCRSAEFPPLEQFRSFKNAKSVKKDPAAEDQELEELKKKYANATWTNADETLLREARAKMSSGVRRPANPAISEIAVVRVTVAPDAEPGPRELRVATPMLLSNPVVFHVGQLKEFSKEASKAITEQQMRSAYRQCTQGSCRGAGDQRHTAGRHQRSDPAGCRGSIPV